MNITKVRCTVERAGSTVGMFDADLIFISGTPHVVFEWEPQQDGSEKPVHLVSLDPAFLKPVVGWGEVTQVYERPVVDPRLLS